MATTSDGDFPPRRGAHRGAATSPRHFSLCSTALSSCSPFASSSPRGPEYVVDLEERHGRGMHLIA
jgi:hypothetical protein